MKLYDYIIINFAELEWKNFFFFIILVTIYIKLYVGFLVFNKKEKIAKSISKFSLAVLLNSDFIRYLLFGGFEAS